MKKTFSTVVLIVLALVIAAVIIAGACLDHIIKAAVETYGPRMTETSVALTSVHLSLLTGSAKVDGLVVGNPQGYKSPESIDIGSIAVGVNPVSILTDKIVIRSIRLESPQITFEGGLSGNNLSQILDNVNSSDKSSGATSTNAAAAPKSEKKLEVDDLLITGAKVNVILQTTGEQQMLSLPDIHLMNLGQGGEGITASDLACQTLNAITTATIEAVATTAANLDKNAASLKSVGKDATQQLGNNLNNLLKK